MTTSDDVSTLVSTHNAFQLLMGHNKPVDRSVTDETIDTDLMLVAKSCNGAIFCGDGRSTDKLVCYGCGKSVHWVAPFDRSRNGVVHRVKGHFRHTKRSYSCKSETIEHRAAKHVVQSTDAWHFFVRCASSCCQNQFDVDVPNGHKSCELPFKGYFLDVGCQNESGAVIGAIEILHTHALPKDKREALTSSGLAWVEVTSHRVLSAYKEFSAEKRIDSLSVQVADCAALLCVPCREKEEAAKIATHAHKLEEAARTQREMRALEHDAANLVLEMNSRNTNDALGLGFWYDVVGAAMATNGLDMSTQVRTSLAKTASDAAESRSAVQAAIERGSERLTFGKYEGQPLEIVWQSDPSYVRWVAGFTGYRSDTSNKPEGADSEARAFVSVNVRSEARSLIKGKCYLCFTDTFSDWKAWCSNCYRRAAS